MKSKMELKDTENSQRDELLVQDLKGKIKEMVRERENDTQLITQLLEASQKKLIKDVN